MSTFTLAKTGCLFALCALLSFSSKAQLHAQFSATPVSGCTPLLVNFSDLSTGNPNQWRWDLGNGVISFVQNPSVTYFTPGQYNIKLVVKNAGGADSILKSQYITIYAQPVVQFTSSAQTGCYPLSVQFTDQSTNAGSTITQWQWDFGDGTFGNTQNPSHTYTASGIYNVSLALMNSNGCTKTLTKAQYIVVAGRGIPAFSNTTSNSCTAPVNINFQNLTAGSGPFSYIWNFGDGSPFSAQANPSHSYNANGSYTVTLIVINSSGCRDTLIKPNAVIIGTVHSSFNSPDSTCIGTSLTLTNTSSPVPASSAWDFGDATTASVISPVKSYTMAGIYLIKLLNNFGACADSVVKTIVVSPLPTADFFSNDTLSCVAPYTSHFINASTDAVSYQWTFGDGGTSSQVDPVHVYNAPGSYTVTLVATNSFGCTNTITKTNYIRIQPPVVTINNLPQRGCAPLTWTFTSTAVSSEPITTYQWDFGDGGTSNLENPTHTFDSGSYTIKLIVTTAGGCTDTVSVTNGIRAGIKAHTNFSATPLNACAYIPIDFSDLSTGNPDQWLWDFGDGTTSVGHNPSHLYADTGFFSIQLITWNNGCPDTLKFDQYVHISPPIASFTIGATCKEPLKRVFTDGSIGADEWNWDFGDGNTSNVQSPTHIYATDGTYTVTLIVKNYLSGCTSTSTKITRLIAEHANFTVTDSVICRKNSVTFTSIIVNLLNIGAHQWDFGDGTTGVGLHVTHTYTNAGLYNVRLIIVDFNGCRDTLIKPHYIRVNGPTAGFSVPASTTCLLSTVTFTDTSASDGLHPIVEWTWNYGDGNIQTLTSGPFQHTYATAGIYTVKLTVKDDTGCTDSIAKPNLLTISKPIAAFKTVDTVTCPGRNIQFQNTSTGSSLIYSWNFGDGGTSAIATPVHAYASNGIYTVKLVVYDQYGCSDSLIRINYITIRTPAADFTVSDSIGSCPPLIVNFTNTSQNFSSVSWDFGDGTTSNSANPSHFYNIPGIYYAILTTTGPGGCTSIKQQKITVKGPYGSFTYGPLTGCQPLTVTFRASTRNRVSFIWDFSDGTTLATTDSVIAHAYTIPGRYLPKMILLDAGGCIVPIAGPDTLVVHGVHADMSFNAVPVCDAGAVQFTSTSTTDDTITSYEWNFDDGGTSAVANPNHLYSSPGTYFPYIKVITSFGCTDSIRSHTPIKIVASPKAIITKSADGCVPVTISLTGSLAVADTSAITWQWNFGNGNNSALNNPPSQIYSVAGSYPVSLVVSNSTGCKDTALANVEAFAIPDVNAGTDTVICYRRGQMLQATGAATYLWSPAAGLSCTNCANPIATPDSIKTYIVTGTTIHGCSKSDNITVSLRYPFPMTNSAPDTLCVGSSVTISASGAFKYTWSPATGLSNATSATQIASPTVTTNYMVIGSDDRNCFSDTAYIPVKVYNIPTVEAGDDKTINVGQTVDLIPVISADVNKVIWNPTGSIFRNDFPAASVKPRETTTYSVEVSNPGGCRSRDYVTIHVICNGANVFIPNTFSPNADGANDIFYVRGKGLFRIKSARIFNRWGEVVYEKNDIMPNESSSGWDGTYKGQKLNSDVFVYIIEIMCDNNTVLTYKGNIALIK